MDAHSKGLVLGFGLVMLSILAAVICKQIQTGGAGFTHLSKTIRCPVERINWDFFMRRLHKRLDSLGFKPVGEDNVFTQAGVDLMEFGAASHTRTKKMLTVHSEETDAKTVTALLTLRYLGVVVVDTGESAYRDAVLDFVSGNKDEMVAVPTESLLALNSFIGGVIAAAIAAMMILSGNLGMWTAIPGIGVTEIAVGFLALYAIDQKPAEITGRWKAIAGIILSASAVVASIVYIITTSSS